MLFWRCFEAFVDQNVVIVVVTRQREQHEKYWAEYNNNNIWMHRFWNKVSCEQRFFPVKPCLEPQWSSWLAPPTQLLIVTTGLSRRFCFFLMDTCAFRYGWTSRADERIGYIRLLFVTREFQGREDNDIRWPTMTSSRPWGLVKGPSSWGTPLSNVI